MNRNLIIGIILVVVVGLGYYQFSMKPAQQAQAVATQAAADATKAAADAAAATTKAAADAAAATTKAASDAAAATTAAATTAAAATTTAATTAASAVTDAAAAVLDPANWDATKVTAMITASSLDDATKKTLTDAVTAAGTDATKIGDVITQIKAALKM
jgi:cytoskeletal protein RodZ